MLWTLDLDPLVGRIVEACEIAYDHDTDSIRAKLAKLGFELEERFPRGTERHFSCTVNAGGRPMRLLAFRGTEKNWDDILTDVNAPRRMIPRAPAAWPGQVAVSASFWEDLDAYWQADVIRLMGRPGMACMTAGHSLGAALAFLAAVRGRRALAPVKAATLVAPPRSAGPGLAPYITGLEIRRYVNCCDVVPRVPPRACGFRDYGDLYYIDRDGTIRTNSTAPGREWDRLLAFAGAELDAIKHPGDLSRWQVIGLRDHRIAGYVAATSGDALPGR